MAVNRSREAWKTYGNVFDEFTIRNLQVLTSQGYFEEMVESVQLGKEANVFRAVTKDEKSVAVKIYRLENANFNKMYMYISQDPRYLDLRGDKRRIIFSWAQREYRNLLKAREVIRVPTPLTFKNNIIVSEFIGEGEVRAPMLKDAHLEAPREVFDEIIVMVTKLFKAGMVHGDLSQFNILYHHEKPVFIDFSQSSVVESPLAKEMLQRDLANICAYFKRYGIDADPQTLFEQITAKEVDEESDDDASDDAADQSSDDDWDEDEDDDWNEGDEDDDDTDEDDEGDKEVEDDDGWKDDEFDDSIDENR